MRFANGISLALLCQALALPVAAMSLSPTQVEMTSVGKASQARIVVVNNSPKPLPVEATMKRAILNEAGIAQTTEATDDFLVMPAQALIPPGASQVFRIQWLGEPLLAESQSYLLYMNQIPVKFSKSDSRLQVVFSMAAMINVAPPQGESNLRVVEAGVTIDAAGHRRPKLTVENMSNVHALLPRTTIRVVGGGWSETLTPGLLSQNIGIGLVQPGRRRTFVLPATVPPGVSRLQVELQGTQKR
jgi:fimbrial chaperone protein